MFAKHSKISIVFVSIFLILAFGLQGALPVQAGAENLQAGTIYRVSTTGATSLPCGADWSTTCDLQFALSTATSGAEIWVQQGTYTPGATRDDYFSLKNGVALYGGFDGTETARSERDSDPATNGTVLSGDIGTAGSNGDNSYHVVVANYVTNTAVLDGFTITGGNADGATLNFGGGFYVSNSYPTLTNLIVTQNASSNAGGGIYITSSETLRANYRVPVLTSVVISNNTALRGGGIYNQNANPKLTDVVFSGNTASTGAGGGMNNQTLNTTDEYSIPELTNVTFSGNSAKGGGGLYNNNSNPILKNVTFSGNTAANRGGAIFNEGASPTLQNVTISGNSAPVSTGGGIQNITYATSGQTSNPVIENSILWGDTVEEIYSDGTGTITLTDTVVQGGCPSLTGVTCTNVISTDPVLSALASNGGFTQTRALGVGSSAINAGGVNVACLSTDQRGATRPQGSACDTGSYEAYVLIVTADSKTINYGDPEPDFTFQYSGFSGGDTDAILDTLPTCDVTGAHTNAGSYTIECSGGADDKYLFINYVDATLTINKLTPTLSVTNSPVTYDGAPHAATVTGSVTGSVSNILTGGSATQTDANTYAVTADFTPSDTTNYNSLAGASAGNFVINKATPVLSIDNSPVLYDGAPHAASVSANVAGTVTNVLTGGSATKTNAGTYTVTASFTPSDLVNYNTLTNVTIGDFIITKVTPTLSITNSPVTYDGQPHSASVEGSVPGNVSNILTGGAASQINAGTYAVVADFTPTDTVNYNSLTNSAVGNFIINKVTPTLSVTNSPVLFNGEPHAATVEASVAGTVSNVLTGGAASQVNVGTYAVTANFTPTDTTNYEALVGASAGNFVISSDITPPTVVSIARADGSPTSAASVTFNVTFSENVTSVDPADFALNVGGVTGASITSVNGSGTAYTVVVNTGSLNGTLGLNIPAPTTITDIAGNPLSNVPFTGEIYSVNKGVVTPPSVPSLVSPANNFLTTDYTPALDWSNSTYANGVIFDHYQLQVATDAGFTSLVKDVTIAGAANSNYTFPSDLASNIKYYWRVRSANLAGVTSNWSAVRTFRTALTPPVLVSPAETSDALTLRPAFDWDDVANATGYTIQFSKNNTFTQIVHTGNPTVSTYTPSVDLVKNTKLYWRVMAKGANGPSAPSGVWWFTSANSPSTPAPSLPANNALDKTYLPLFKWSAVTLPTGTNFKHYQLQVDDNADFSSPEINDTSITNRTTIQFQTSTALAHNIKYYWRVRAVNTGNEESNWSTVRSFRTLVDAPVLLLPDIGFDATTPRPFFDWDAPSGPEAVTGYTIQFSKNAAFTQIVHTGSPLTSQYTPTADLPKNLPLYWRVQTKGANGPSAWSEIRSFLSANSPSTPAPSLPGNNALITNYLPLFKWSAVTLPTGTDFKHYHLQVDDNADFSSPEINDTSITNRTTVQFQTSTALAQNTKFYWRVKAVNDDDEESNWSTVRTLRTIVSAPTLLAPANGSPAGSLKPLFDWEDATGPGTITSYTFQVSASPTFGTTLVSSTTVASTYTPIKNLPAGKTLYWRVKVNGANGPSAWSTVFTFTTP